MLMATANVAHTVTVRVSSRGLETMDDLGTQLDQARDEVEKADEEYLEAIQKWSRARLRPEGVTTDLWVKLEGKRHTLQEKVRNLRELRKWQRELPSAVTVPLPGGSRSA